MARLKYNPDRKTIQFQGPGRSMLAAVTELQKQTTRVTEAQEKQRLQAAKQADLQIGGLSRKAEFEEKNTKRLHKLEDDVRKHGFEAFKTFADTDVERLEGEYKISKKYADFMAEYAPKKMKLMMDAGVKGAVLIDKYLAFEAQKKWDDDPKSTEQNEAHLKEYLKIEANRTKDMSSINDDLSLKGFGMNEGTHSFQQGAYAESFFNDNKTSIYKEYESTLQGIFSGPDGGTVGITQHNAEEVWEFAGRLFLNSRNINPTSLHGKKILRSFRQQGRLVALGKKDTDDVAETTRLLDLKSDLVQGLRTQETVTIDGVEYSGLNTNFNQGVIYASGGTYEDGDDVTRLVPNQNLREGFEMFLPHFLVRNWDKFGGKEENVREFLSTMYVPDKKSASGLGTENWLKKHPAVVDEALKKWRTELKRQTTILQEKGALEAGQYLIDTNAKIDEIKKANNGVLPNEDRLNIINSVSKTKFKDTDKQKIYNLVDFDATGYDSGSVYVSAIRAFNDSREGDFIQALGNMNEAARKRLANEIRLLDVIRKGQSPELSGNTQVNGLKAVDRKSAADIQSISKGYTISGPALTTSGKQIAVVYKQLFMNELDLNLDGDGTEKQKVLNAWTTVKKQYLDTASPLEPIPGGKPGQYRLVKGAEKPGAFLGNPLNFVPAAGGEAGLTKPGVEFPYATDPDQNIANSLHDLYINKGKTEEGTWIDTNDKLPGVQVLEYSDHTILSRRTDDVIKGERLVSPDIHNQFVEELDKVALNPALTLDLEAIMPERLRFLADKTGHTYPEIVNSYFAVRGMEHRVSADKSSAAIIRNGKAKKPLPWNMEGENIFVSVQAQGSYCMEPTVFNEMVDGLDRLDSFTHKFEIKTYTDEGNGKITFSDVPKFFNEGGARQLTPDLAMNMGLLRWDDKQGWKPGVNMLSSYKKDLARHLRNKPVNREPATLVPLSLGGELRRNKATGNSLLSEWNSRRRELESKIRKLEVENDK